MTHKPDSEPKEEMVILKIRVTSPQGHETETHLFNLAEAPQALTPDTPKRLKWMHLLKYGHLYAEGSIPPELACEPEMMQLIQRYRELLKDPEFLPWVYQEEMRRQAARQRRSEG